MTELDEVPRVIIDLHEKDKAELAHRAVWQWGATHPKAFTEQRVKAR